MQYNNTRCIKCLRVAIFGQNLTVRVLHNAYFVLFFKFHIPLVEVDLLLLLFHCDLQ